MVWETDLLTVRGVKRRRSQEEQDVLRKLPLFGLSLASSLKLIGAWKTFAPAVRACAGHEREERARRESRANHGVRGGAEGARTGEARRTALARLARECRALFEHACLVHAFLDGAVELAALRRELRAGGRRRGGRECPAQPAPDRRPLRFGTQ